MKRLKAQQISEFVLAAPLLVLFFVILTEFAFAFNTNLVLNNAVKSSIVVYLNTISEDAQKIDYENAIKNYVKTDFEKNKIGNINSLNVKLISVNEYPAVVADYIYMPGFGFSFLPALKTIKMNAVTVFPLKMPKTNAYESGISTEELNLIQPQAVQAGGVQ